MYNSEEYINNKTNLLQYMTGSDFLALGPANFPWIPAAGLVLGPGSPMLCWATLLTCLSLACAYVGSLYVWNSHLILIVSGLSPLFVWLWKELTGIKPGTSLLVPLGF
uniref:Uncharacterized protein n=1 Tax=Gopherus agassizii TaxID=38772 RepID=A0A452GYN6_9SAUR